MEDVSLMSSCVMPIVLIWHETRRVPTLVDKLCYACNTSERGFHTYIAVNNLFSQSCLSMLSSFLRRSIASPSDWNVIDYQNAQEANRWEALDPVKVRDNNKSIATFNALLFVCNCLYCRQLIQFLNRIKKRSTSLQSIDGECFRISSTALYISLIFR